MIQAIIESTTESMTAIIVALIGVGVLGVRRRVKRVQNQVENGHDTNLREEADDRHQETTEALQLLMRGVEHLARDIGGIRSDIRSLQGESHRQRDRIDDLESITTKETS